MVTIRTSSLLMACCAASALSILQPAHAEPPLQKMTARLDLKAPSDIFAAGGGQRLLESGAARRFASQAAAGPESGHIMSPVERMVHNFNQEGLPVARLFQNSNSLVHLGLNPKGKPGLWLVHKLH